MFDVSVVYLLRESQGQWDVLLGEKLTGLGVGKIVGPGGKWEPGESAEQAACREVAEEVGISLDPGHLTPIAVVEYPFVTRPELSQKSHAFLATTFDGTPTSSPELNPAWWPRTQMPWDAMWADAKLWLPRALDGEFLHASFAIDADNSVASSQMTWSPLRRS
jgi:8-oxo-dGTP pyrophosphatase MutT (NUDIX family)